MGSTAQVWAPVLERNVMAMEHRLAPPPLRHSHEIRLSSLIPLAVVLSACPPPPVGPKKVVCNDANGTQLCWKERFCASNPKEICAVHLNGDKGLADLYDEAVFDGTCNSGTEPDLPIPPCVCEYPVEDVEICTADSSGDPTSGDPTTGDPGPDLWICTVHSQSKCVYYNYVTDPVDPDFKGCWVDPNLSDNVQPCVAAEDFASAKAQCEALCQKAKMDVEEAEVDGWNDVHATKPREVVGTAIDCTLDDSPLGDEPEILTAPYVCESLPSPLLAWGGVTTLRSFESTTGLAMSSGGSTASGDIIGYIGFDVSNCSSGTCDVTIDALEIAKTDVAGTLADAAGPIATYAIEGVDMRLTQVVHGTLHQRTGNIVFPTEPFIGILTADEVSIDNTPIGAWETTQYVTQATGALSSTNVLTLNLTLNLDGGVVTMSLQTIE